MSIHIVEAELTHVPVILPLFAAYRRFYRQPNNSELEAQYLQQRLKNKETRLFIAFNAQQQAVGFMHLFPFFTSVGLAKHWILNDLYVSETARGQGVASKLIDIGKAVAIETDAKGLFLQTESNNLKARALYEHLGFTHDNQSAYYEWISPKFNA